MAYPNATPGAAWIVIESPAGELCAHQPGCAVMHSLIAGGWRVARICRGDRDAALKEMRAAGA